MAKPPGIRRYLRFSLRSLLVLTLAVAAWLGYEVHQARTVQRQARAIRALGGEVEFEASPWSLLRFVEPRTYGRRVVIAQIPADGLDEAVSRLNVLPHLREVRLALDGRSDVRQKWDYLRAELNGKRLVPVA